MRCVDQGPRRIGAASHIEAGIDALPGDRAGFQAELQLEDPEVGIRCVARARADACGQDFGRRLEPEPDEGDAALRGGRRDTLPFLGAQEGGIDDGV